MKTLFAHAMGDGLSFPIVSFPQEDEDFPLAYAIWSRGTEALAFSGFEFEELDAVPVLDVYARPPLPSGAPQPISWTSDHIEGRKTNFLLPLRAPNTAEEEAQLDWYGRLFSMLAKKSWEAPEESAMGAERLRRWMWKHAVSFVRTHKQIAYSSRALEEIESSPYRRHSIGPRG